MIEVSWLYRNLQPPFIAIQPDIIAHDHKRPNIHKRLWIILGKPYQPTEDNRKIIQEVLLDQQVYETFRLLSQARSSTRKQY